MPILCHAMPLSELSIDKNLAFNTVQFSILNDNYVYVLTSDGKFRVVCLTKDIRIDNAEQTFNLTVEETKQSQVLGLLS